MLPVPRAYGREGEELPAFCPVCRRGTMTRPLPGYLGEQAVLGEYRGVGQTVSDSRRGQRPGKGMALWLWVGMAWRDPWTFQVHRPHILSNHWHNLSRPLTPVAPTLAKHKTKTEKEKKKVITWMMVRHHLSMNQWEDHLWLFNARSKYLEGKIKRYCQ